MPNPVLVLASASATRARLLGAAGIPVDIVPARIDEDNLRDSLIAEGASIRDIADTLAEHKAMKISHRQPRDLVLGCDQTLECQGRAFSKPSSRDAAAIQLAALSGQTHLLHSAGVLYQGGQPLWRHVTTVRMTMRPLDDTAIDSYLDRCWPDVAQSVGCYQIETSGLRLFSRIDGDYFAILGLPLTQLINYLIQNRKIAP